MIGIGKEDNGKPAEYFVASDATPIVEHTKNVVYLNDEEIAVASEATKYSAGFPLSSLPMPITSGLPFRAAKILSGSFFATITMA